MASVLLGEVELAKSPIPDECTRMLREATIRKDGCVWRIHKNDSDPFPSNPHAHNIESGFKVDLSTGNLYLQTDWTGKRVSKKDLAAILSMAARKGIAFPAAWV